ncbi:MAG: DUF2288 domain-containing protein [Pseudanabaenaceae cyanobacterium]
MKNPENLPESMTNLDPEANPDISESNPPCQPKDLRTDLTEMLETVHWGLVAPHAKRARAILVAAHLDMVDVAVNLAEDNAPVVKQWIDDSWLAHPTAEQLTQWNDQPDSLFECLVIPPFVLVRPAAAE